jgi:hypothetical protein
VSTFLSLVLEGDDGYTAQEPWRDEEQQIQIAVNMTGPRSGFTTIQGPPGELHRLAAALTKAASAAEEWAAKHPRAAGIRGGRMKARTP